MKNFQKALNCKVEKSRTSNMIFMIKWTYKKPLNAVSGSRFQSLFVAAHFKILLTTNYKNFKSEVLNLEFFFLFSESLGKELSNEWLQHSVQ